MSGRDAIQIAAALNGQWNRFPYEVSPRMAGIGSWDSIAAKYFLA